MAPRSSARHAVLARRRRRAPALSTTTAAPPARDRLLVAVAVALVVVPVAVDLAVSGSGHSFAYLAADSFYYLVVGRNWALHGRISFDGTHATNGFQLLWQAAVTALTRVTSWLGLGDRGVLVGAVLLGLLALAVTVWLCGRALALAHGRVHPLYLLVPAGVYAMVLAPVWVLAGGLSAWGADPREGSLPLYGTLWSDANGMETSLALLAFGGLLLFVVRAVPRGRDGVFLGLLLGALVLARLDLAFVVVGIGSTLVVAALREGAATVRRCTMAGAAVCAAIVAGYLGWNR